MVILLKTLSISARQTLSLSSTRLYKRIQTSHFTKALLPDLQFNYELQRWMTSGVCTNDINRHKQTQTDSLFFSTLSSAQVDFSNCLYTDSRRRIDGAGGWHCLTIRTRKIYFHWWSHKSKGEVWWWCKKRIVAHLFHRYWQMPEH